MTDAELKSYIHRWMNGQGAVAAEIAALDPKERREFLAHVDKISKRSVSVERLGDAIRKAVG